MTGATAMLLCFLLALVPALLPVPAVRAAWLLPDTSGIDGQLTANLQVDRFFGLWLVFNEDELTLSDKPFTILAPVNAAGAGPGGAGPGGAGVERLLANPAHLKRLLLDHVVLGKTLDLDIGADLRFATLAGRTVKVQNVNGTLMANGAKVLQRRVEVPHGILVILDNYLFPKDLHEPFEESTTSNPGPPKLEAANTIGESEQEQALPSALPHVAIAAPSTPATSPGPGTSPTSAPADDARNVTGPGFLRNVVQVLSFLKSGVRVFQHFLARSNVSKLLKDGETYTLLVPTDRAFQRWHPIDWGFYPFSVPEFSESTIVNHFLKGDWRAATVPENQVVYSLEDRPVVFSRKPNLTANGVPVVGGDTPVQHGNILFVSEVLFVNEEVVARLHEHNRDKETPPLVAFPWIGSQFLSHAFLALEETSTNSNNKHKFNHITRFLNMANNLAAVVSGPGYTFFVPTDAAFEELGLDTVPDRYLATGAGLQVLLNHLVHERLYERDLVDGTKLKTLGNKTIHVRRPGGNITVNDANVVKSEVFVYNLGTMYYIDKVLFATKADLPLPDHNAGTTLPARPTTQMPEEVETIPSELAGNTGSISMENPEGSVEATTPPGSGTDATETPEGVTKMPAEGEGEALLKVGKQAQVLLDPLQPFKPFTMAGKLIASPEKPRDSSNAVSSGLGHTTVPSLLDKEGATTAEDP